MKTKDTIASLKRIISEKEEELKAAQDAAESAQNNSEFRLRAYNDLVDRYQKVQGTNNRWEKAYEALAHRVERCHKRILLEINTRKTLRKVLGFGDVPLTPDDLVKSAERFAAEHAFVVEKRAEAEDRFDRVIRAANEDRRLHELKVQSLTTQNRILTDHLAEANVARANLRKEAQEFADAHERAYAETQKFRSDCQRLEARVQELLKENQSWANTLRAARGSERAALDKAAHNHKLYDLACRDRQGLLTERQTLLQRIDTLAEELDGLKQALDSNRDTQVALEHQLSDAWESLRDRYVELEAAADIRKELCLGKIPVRCGWIIFWRTFKHWVARRPVAAQWTKEEI